MDSHGSRCAPVDPAPRRLQRIPEVHQFESSSSEWAFAAKTQIPIEIDVLILDTMGRLAGLYSSAHAAFIGGTFDAQFGGHSPAEAFRWVYPSSLAPISRVNPAAWTNGWCETVDISANPNELAAAIHRTLARGPGDKPQLPNIQALMGRLPNGHTSP